MIKPSAIITVTLWNALLLWSSINAYSIPPIANFAYTVASAPFLSIRQCDSIAKETALRLATQSGVPQELALIRYPKYAAIITRLTKPLILQGFHWIESTASSSQQAKPETEQFNKERTLHVRQVEKAVQKIIYSNELRTFLAFNKSDRITHFVSEVYVQHDGWLDVREEITIYNGNGEQHTEEGKDIKVNNDIQRGIMREFPTKYKERNGFLKIVPFELISATCNGKKETTQQVRADNGISLRLGNASVFLDEGVYTYVIRYRTTEQLYFAKDYDELYWNVTGNGWRLRIDAAECRVHFPLGSVIRKVEGFTGYQGDTNHHYISFFDSTNVLSFATTTALDAEQGFTISAFVNKGTLHVPEQSALFSNFLHDNLILPIFGGGLAFLLGLNFLLWWKYGKDPKKETIIPRFEPPAGLSPAEVGYIHSQESETHLVAASVVDAAVNRYIRIRVEEEGKLLKHLVYYIEALPESGYKKTPYYSFGDSSSLQSTGKIEKGSRSSSMNSFARSVSSFVEQAHLSDPSGEAKKDGLFALNIGKGGYGLFLLIAAGIGMIAYFGVFRNYAPMLLASAVAIFVLGCIQQNIFMRIMKAYSKRGRKIADEIEGFKMYLEATEKHAFNTLTPPAKTLELFEKYLPFAIALKVENKWAEQFNDILNTLDPENALHYHTMASHYSSRSYSSSFSDSFSGSISSASASPSSGGSSSGGSSGGGGGGGGGGGW